MNLKIRELISYMFLFAVLIFFVSSCGAEYRIKGRVVSVPELKSSVGFITELTEQSLPPGGTPVVKAKVRMITQLNQQDKPVEDTVWQKDTLTDENGFFNLSDSGNPTKELKVGIEVSKEGYKTVYKTHIVQSNSAPQVFLIVLAPNDAG